MPQPPQLAGLEVVFVHWAGVPHASVFGGHVQVPPAHTVPPAQTIPQAPQLLGSESLSTQAPAQRVSPAPHVSVHVPCEHTRPLEHALVHAPQ
jgi:hypothetical protein